jgi:ariadne-1
MSDEEDFYEYSDEEAQEFDEIEDFCEDEPPTPTKKKEEEYTVLTLSQVVKRQQQEVEKISEVLGVSNSSARVLLRKFEWKVERIMDTFFDKELAGVLRQAGITLADITFSIQDNEQEDEFDCPLCYDTVAIAETSILGCSHRFCNNCWEQHVEMKILEV